MDTENNKDAAEALDVSAGSAVYPLAAEWIIETSHGIYTPRGWEFCKIAASREDAIRFCEDWAHGPRWDKYRAYNNRTGEIISSSPNTQSEPRGSNQSKT